MLLTADDCDVHSALLRHVQSRLHEMRMQFSESWSCVQRGPACASCMAMWMCCLWQVRMC